MALKHLFRVGSLFTALLLVHAGLVEAQINIPGPRFQHKQQEQPEETAPFLTPGVFDYDAQLFAPVEFDSKDQLEPRIGFYFEFDRTYLSLTNAPQFAADGDELTGTGNNYVFGNRYELGWFTEEDTGWNASFQLNEGNSFFAGQDVLISNPLLATTRIATVEINRVFRQTLSSGKILEPYFGLRYMNVSDETIEDVPQGAGTFNRFLQNATNDAVGFQAGGRYVRRAGRWRTTTDLAFAALHNQQSLFASDIGVDAMGVPFLSAETRIEEQSFVPVLDFQFDITFNVTRDISLKTGVQTFYLWDGINRANSLTQGLNPNSVISGGGTALVTNDTDFIAAGFIFGVEWRR